MGTALQQIVLQNERGEDHGIHKLRAMGDLTMTYRAMERLEEAAALEEAALEVRKAIYGEKHYDTLVAMDLLALTYTTQGRLNEADYNRLSWRQGGQCWAAVLGERDIRTLHTMVKLAITYRN